MMRFEGHCGRYYFGVEQLISYVLLVILTERANATLRRLTRIRDIIIIHIMHNNI